MNKKEFTKEDIKKWRCCSDTKEGWIENKELYSEKFLNQEVEIEEETKC